MDNTKTASIWCELKQDLLANGWDNGKIGTVLRIIFLELSFHTLLFYRLQVRINKIPAIGPTLRRIIAWFAGVITSCEISVLAKIEGGVIVPHPKGICIGKGCIIKKGATIYQHVTIGTKSGHGEQEQYPIIESGAKLYTGCVIAGGLRIGENAVVGANSVVLHDVPDGKTAVGIPARIL
jgi:serine O-acetyltransferase